MTEITLDMAGNVELICKRCFPQATRVTDRFHVHKLATEALQKMDQAEFLGGVNF